MTETTATRPSGRNLLEELDSRIPTTFYWHLATLACVGGFLFGYDTSNIGSALPFIPYHLSSFATGYLVAGASLGAAAGVPIAGPLTDRFGRKSLLITAILGAVNVIATYFAFRYIDRLGRRPLAIGGYFGMAVFMLLSAFAVAWLTDLPQTVVVMVGFSFFITSFAIGVGGTGWLIQGEVFPTPVRGRAAAIAAAVDWLANYALIEAFPAWKNGIGLGWVMVCFAILSVAAIGFLVRWLPETKGRSVEEVVDVFEKAAAGRGRLAAGRGRVRGAVRAHHQRPRGGWPARRRGPARHARQPPRPHGLAGPARLTRPARRLAGDGNHPVRSWPVVLVR